MKIKENQDYYLRVFTMYNEKVDVHSLVIDKVGLKIYGYFRILVHTMDRTNRLDFNCLGVSDVTTKRVRAKLHEVGFIRKCKIDNEVGFDWYMNPYLANKNNRKNPELDKIFLSNENLPKQVSSKDVQELNRRLF